VASRIRYSAEEIGFVETADNGVGVRFPVVISNFPRAGIIVSGFIEFGSEKPARIFAGY
jgi:hypothetical protein